jgi:hypothetical protein
MDVGWLLIRPIMRVISWAFIVLQVLALVGAKATNPASASYSFITKTSATFLAG